jgi:hypothetical protein
MKLAEGTLPVFADMVYVPHLDRLTLVFTTQDPDFDSGPQHWDYRFPVQMTRAEAEQLAEKLWEFAQRADENTSDDVGVIHVLLPNSKEE